MICIIQLLRTHMSDFAFHDVKYFEAAIHLPGLCDLHDLDVVLSGYYLYMTRLLLTCLPDGVCVVFLLYQIS